jgi:hypothetical protein
MLLIALIISLLLNWVMFFNCRKEITDHTSTMDAYMMERYDHMRALDELRTRNANRN